MFSFDNVCRRFGDTAVLDGFSVSFDEGRVTCILGASGCGKTTLLRLASGLDRPDSGRVELPSGKYSFLFQENRLLPWLDTLQNVAIVCDEASARTALEKVGLGEELHTKPAALSGGMRRRAALARALAHSSEFLLLDEPFAGLDESLRASLLPLLKTEAQRRPVLFVTHDPREAQSLGASVLELHGSPAGL